MKRLKINLKNKFKLNHYIKVISFICIILNNTSCNKNKEDQIVGEKRLNDFIEKYYEKLELEENGIYFIKQKTGNGSQATEGDSIYITYQAYYITDNSNEELFTSRDRDDPLKFKLGEDNSVLEGLEKGIKMMREHDTATLIIPYNFGYGGVQTGTVPAYSPLKLYVELLYVSNN